MKINLLSWLPKILTTSRNDDDVVQGTLWHGESKAAVSCDETGSTARICFRNRTDETLMLCWISESGSLHHYYALDPWRGTPKLRGFARNRRGAQILNLTDEDHVETTKEGHAFLIASADDIDTCRHEKSMNGAHVIGSYRPEKKLGCPSDTAEDSDSDDHEAPMVHLVEIKDPVKESQRWSCRGSLFCRPKKRKIDETDDTSSYFLTVRNAFLDDTPLDTTTKEYECTTYGECGWPVQLECKWYGKDSELEAILQRDLDHMSRCLPPHAVKLLRDTNPTPVWVNHTLKYGPQACPVKANGMCFHPGRAWLVQQGMHPEKCESVELYCSANYKRTREHWGTGGILVHEFSHAFHHKGCKDGYKNKEILECYEKAMKERLYDSVRVHGPQGPKAKAYACTNAMEYFAELSTAFLGGSKKMMSERKRGTDEEYNKWYPFNRQQLREHDPRAYELLKKIWGVPDDNE